MALWDDAIVWARVVALRVPVVGIIPGPSVSTRSRLSGAEGIPIMKGWLWAFLFNRRRWSVFILSDQRFQALVQATLPSGQDRRTGNTRRAPDRRRDSGSFMVHRPGRDRRRMDRRESPDMHLRNVLQMLEFSIELPSARAEVLDVARARLVLAIVEYQRQGATEH